MRTFQQAQADALILEAYRVMKAQSRHYNSIAVGSYQLAAKKKSADNLRTMEERLFKMLVEYITGMTQGTLI